MNVYDWNKIIMDYNFNSNRPFAGWRLRPAKCKGGGLQNCGQNKGLAKEIGYRDASRLRYHKCLNKTETTRDGHAACWCDGNRDNNISIVTALKYCSWNQDVYPAIRTLLGNFVVLLGNFMITMIISLWKSRKNEDDNFFVSLSEKIPKLSLGYGVAELWQGR